jgi:hypothetical protein
MLQQHGMASLALSAVCKECGTACLQTGSKPKPSSEWYYPAKITHQSWLHTHRQPAAAAAVPLTSINTAHPSWISAAFKFNQLKFSTTATHGKCPAKPKAPRVTKVTVIAIPQ